MAVTLEEMSSKFMGVVDDLGKARVYIAQLEKDKAKLARERDELLGIVNGVARNMAEVVKSFKR